MGDLSFLTINRECFFRTFKSTFKRIEFNVRAFLLVNMYPKCVFFVVVATLDVGSEWRPSGN